MIGIATINPAVNDIFIEIPNISVALVYTNSIVCIVVPSGFTRSNVRIGSDNIVRISLWKKNITIVAPNIEIAERIRNAEKVFGLLQVNSYKFLRVHRMAFDR